MTATVSADKVTAVAEDLIETLQNLAPEALFAQLGNEKMTTLKYLANIFKKVTPTAAPEEPTTPETVRPAQKVPRVDTPEEARQQPLLRVL